MSLKAALHQYLATKSAVTTLVPAARIFRGHRPTGSPLPAITYFRVSHIDHDHQTAASGLAQTRMQFDVWASTDSSAEAIWEALRGALHTLMNTSIGSEGDATTIDLVRLENATDAAEWPQDGSDNHVYNISVDAMIWHRVTVPSFS